MNISDKEKSSLRDLETKIGLEIPRVHQSEELPLDPESMRADDKRRLENAGKYRSFKEFTGHSNFGCFISPEGNVVGLALCNMNLTSIPNEILTFKHLKRLNLGDNKLRSLPRKIENLEELDQLQLFGNRISKIPVNLRSLSALTMINLASNNFREFPEIVLDVPNIRTIYFFDNRIVSLPESFFEKDFEVVVDRRERGRNSTSKVVYLEDNPIESPPIEIIRRGRDAIFEYFAALSADTQPLNEVKMIIVGDGGAGKTSLVKRLLERGFDPHEAQTHGINIDTWDVDTASEATTVNIWDFGGQEIMHATHQFFLSDRSLYVLVLDGRKDEDPEYWLKHVQSFGGNSPVLIVLNKVDQHPGFEVNRRFLKQKYPSIHSLHRVSCETEEGMQEVRDAIAVAIDLVEITRTEWPKPWFDIKRELQNLDEKFIRYDDFRSTCFKHGVSKKAQQEILVTFLHDLGSIVHFSDFRLRDTHVLDPRWLTGAVYRIINDITLAENHGILSLSDISNILESEAGESIYPPETHAYVIDIMKKFELCYSIDSSTILVPDLLGVQEPDLDFPFDDSLAFEIHYDFLPRSILPRFIVRQHMSIIRELRWRTGAVLEDATLESKAVVRSDQLARKIYINVAGKQKRDYLTVIRASFAEINSSFEKLSFSERLPMPDDPDVSISYKHLLMLEGQGENRYFPDGANHPYNVQELLGTIRIEAKYGEQELMRILQSIINETDSQERIIEKANSVVMMQPNFMGMGVNLNALAEKVLKWKTKKKNDG